MTVGMLMMMATATAAAAGAGATTAAASLAPWTGWLTYATILGQSNADRVLGGGPSGLPGPSGATSAPRQKFRPRAALWNK
jgi:hypothetical protein